MVDNTKLNQVGSVIIDEKLNQLGSVIEFPKIFAYVPWRHHVLIVQKSKSVEEALFYIQKTVEEGLSRSALDNYIRADLKQQIELAEAELKMAQGEENK